MGFIGVVIVVVAANVIVLLNNDHTRATHEHLFQQSSRENETIKENRDFRGCL